ncbi:MAG TPA: hypothetical protein VEY91_03720 [Candidatus Limnocylindria bacterium]|nr:hypothetical protein [Candidatus Limnocylindria bacterium]
MNPWVWATREPLGADFERAWRARLSSTPHANFTLDLRYLQRRAVRDQHALAVLAEEGDRSGLLVLREESGRLQSGWPWRWQAVVESPGRCGAAPLDEGEAQWLFRVAVQVAGPRRIAVHLPVPPPLRMEGYRAGATVMYDVGHSDQELLAAMNSSKRRMVRRALSQGYQVEEATEHEQFRAFAEVQRETVARRGQKGPEVSGETPPPGEGWREWELPWMWLLVATREGRIESGVGDGLMPGGVLEARTGASSDAGRRSGAFALLSHEEARRARDLGYRWINLGGESVFKREAAGRFGIRVPVHRWLGAGRAWRVGVYAETVWHRARAGVAAFARVARVRGGARVMVGAATVDLLTSDAPLLLQLLLQLEGIPCS